LKQQEAQKRKSVSFAKGQEAKKAKHANVNESEAEEIPEEKFYTWFESTGNTVSNTIPIALQHAIRDGRIRQGNTVILVGFGVGLSWSACVVRF
jgi:3-oxoacyl-[acyl-carrier-protein] synthase III